MAEVRYQIGSDRQIVYKKGMEKLAKCYMRKRESCEKNWLLSLLLSIFMFGTLLKMAEVEGNGYLIVFAFPVALIPFAPLYYYGYKHRDCIEKIVDTPRYAYGNTNNRGWWKW